jgi:GNAT superfamily N-acetyltransferase
MQIRAAKETDIPAIVELLKLSLGESLMPKSEAFWRWKHIDNPFGPSPVLLAFDKEELIGVRAFMRWEWQRGDQVFSSLRAVDTATHPQHQGRGIFKKLTSQLLTECKAAGDHFIFNTPNKKSMPGYLKMGWISRGRMPIKLKWQILPVKKKNPELNADWEQLTRHSLLHPFQATSQLQTRLSAAYLLWRYRDNPNASYRLLSADDAQPFILIYRIKTHRFFTEVRITDLICAQADKSFAIHCLQASLSGLKLLSISATADLRFMEHAFWRLPGGPTITTLNLNMPAYPESLNFTDWSPTLGDMELF